jgi:hypothetical protein
MRTILYTLGGVMLISLGILAYLILSPAPYRPIYRATYLLDRTDIFQIDPGAIQTEQQFSWDPLKQGREVRIRKVTDVVNEDITVMALPSYRDLRNPSSWNLEDNELFREHRIRKMEEQVADALSKVNDQQTGYDHSAVMEPLVDELIQLQHYSGDDRVLILFSDLGQHTPTDDWILNQKTINQIESDNPAPWSSIDRVGELTDLKGIRIHIVHRPTSAMADKAFRMRAQYVKAQLTERGATVNIHGAIGHKN